MSTATVTPTDPTEAQEAALRAAFDVFSSIAIDSAAQSADAATARVEAQSTELAKSNRITELRKLLISQHQAVQGY
jgi:hypothetical protein